jgi:uncharacterized membrane protein YphA (DoxX/SURF4 family)
VATAVRNRSAAAAGSSRGAALALRILAVLLGVFFVSMGINKLAWLTDSGILAGKFQIFEKGAPASVRAYIETFAMPGLPLFARLVPLAELATGAALIFGVWVRLAAALAFVMVLNFQFATGGFHTIAFFIDGQGLPVLGALLALAIAGRDLPFSLSK